jgi:hypothetical protein
MRVEVYKGGELAAVLVYGREPVYSGTRGAQAKKLIERPRYVRNLWTGEGTRGPRYDTREWWLSSIYGAHLTEKGFTVFANVERDGATTSLADAVPREPPEAGSPAF